MHDAIAEPLAAPKAGRREWLALTVLALPTLLVASDIGGLQLALPELSEDLHPSTAQQLWITDVYGFLLAGFLITMGNLGDRIGRRRLLLIGAVLFGAASVVAIVYTCLMTGSALGVGIVLGSAPAERAGAAASLSETADNLGPTLGMATLGTLALALYRAHMSSATPVGVPASAAQAARETVAGAASAATSLPAGISRQLLAAAHSAYTYGVDATGIVGAVIFASLAGLVALSARQINAAGGSAAPRAAEPTAQTTAV